MREAAINCGIKSEKLKLVLEPEAACLACQKQVDFARDDIFMVLDCGGGTIDITIHRVSEKLPNLCLDEMKASTGGPWGSTFVDACFVHMIELLIGTVSLEILRASRHWETLMNEWELVKVKYDPSKESSVRIRIQYIQEVCLCPIC